MYVPWLDIFFVSNGMSFMIDLSLVIVYEIFY